MILIFLIGTIFSAKPALGNISVPDPNPQGMNQLPVGQSQEGTEYLKPSTGAILDENIANSLRTALSWAHGPGFSIGLWLAAANSMFDNETSITRGQIEDLLRQNPEGFRIRGSGPDGRSVQLLTENTLVPGNWYASSVRPKRDYKKALKLAEALIGKTRSQLETGSVSDLTYLSTFLWKHCLDAGQQGIELLRNLANDYPDFRFDLARALVTKQSDPTYNTLIYSAEAENIFRELVNEGHERAKFMLQLSLVQSVNNFRNKKLWDEAINPSLELVNLKRNETPVNAASMAIYLLSLGEIYFNARQYIEAVPVLIEAIESYRSSTTDEFLEEHAKTAVLLRLSYLELGEASLAKELETEEMNLRMRYKRNQEEGQIKIRFLEFFLDGVTGLKKMDDPPTT